MGWFKYVYLREGIVSLIQPIHSLHIMLIPNGRFFVLHIQAHAFSTSTVHDVKLSLRLSLKLPAHFFSRAPVSLLFILSRHFSFLPNLGLSWSVHLHRSGNGILAHDPSELLIVYIKRITRPARGPLKHTTPPIILTLSSWYNHNHLNQAPTIDTPLNTCLKDAAYP